MKAAVVDTKRGGWQWHQTKMTDPARATRLWLAIAVATLWVVSVGGEADAMQPCSGLESLPELHIARCTATKRSRPRLQSCFAKSGCDAFSWPCSTDGDCRWDASCRSLGLRPCRLGRSPRSRKSCLPPHRHRRGLLRLVRWLHEKIPTLEREAEVDRYVPPLRLRE